MQLEILSQTQTTQFCHIMTDEELSDIQEPEEPNGIYEDN